jgi:hypothetical protein
MSDQVVVLVCQRVCDLATPQVQSRIASCALCGTQVWVSNSSPPAEQIWCCQCMAKELSEDDEFEPPTEDQWLDVDEYIRRGDA